MKIFNPYIFDLNKNIKIEKNDCGIQITNIFKTPEKIIEFLKNDLIYQNSSYNQGAAPLYRSVIHFNIPSLKSLIKRILYESYGITNITNVDYAANIQPKEMLELKLNSYPHIDTSDFTLILYFDPTNTLVWENTKSKKFVRMEDYHTYVNTDVFPNEYELYKKYFDKVHIVSANYNSGFLLEASKFRHTIGYWNYDEPKDRITMSLFIRIKR